MCKTRIEPALALGGYAVFCDCGHLTGFADTLGNAEHIAAEHVVGVELAKLGPGERIVEGLRMYSSEWL